MRYLKESKSKKQKVERWLLWTGEPGDRWGSEKELFKGYRVSDL